MDLSDILTLLSLLVAVIGATWYISRRIGRLETAYRNVTRVGNGLIGLFGAVIRLSHKRKALNDSELSDIIKSYAELAQVPNAVGTPLLPEEINGLNYYLGKVHRGEFFTAEEVTDYNDLVQKLEKAKKGDPSVIPLIALGAFLLGLFLASKGK